MAVVKADAYGHGLERCARALAGADAFGVASIADGLRLRAAGSRERIVVLSGPDARSDLAEMRRLQLEAVIHHESQLAMLENERVGEPLKVWLKLDTGMHRLGFPPERAREVHARLRALPAVDRDIVLMTHFAASDEFDNDLTARQTRLFLTQPRISPANARSRIPRACSAGRMRAAIGYASGVCCTACQWWKARPESISVSRLR